VAFANNNLTRITIGENVELDNRAFTGFYYFYNYAVDKRGGTYIFNNYHWSPEDKTVPILIFTSDMAENDITGKFSDIAFLTDMPDLEEVSLRDNNLLTDISPLSGLTKLKNLHLRHNNNYDYSALVPLRQLERLVIYYYGDEEGEIDLSHIGQLHSLKGLSITGNIKIINIDALQNLVNLENLEILIGISDISWVSGLRNLTDLVLITSWSIDDISLLATLPNLVNVDLTYTDRIEDITPLLNSNSIKYIRVWAHQVEAGISDNLRSRFKQKNVYLDTFYDYR
jgi:Leucine-rich repeat (LRR) protein